jgi:hypothetical protein
MAKAYRPVPVERVPVTFQVQPSAHGAVQAYATRHFFASTSGALESPPVKKPNEGPFPLFVASTFHQG